MIKDLSDFATEHPFLVFLAIVLTFMLLERIATIPNRIIRHLNIRAQGWPPPHLDANGDQLKTEDED